MNIDESLVSYLLSVSNLTTYVSTRGVFKNISPQNQDLPFVVFERVSAPVHHAMVSDPKIYSPRYQFNSYSTSQSQLGGIAKELVTALQDYSSTAMGGAGGVDVKRIFMEMDGMDMTDIDPETKQITYKKIHDFIIWYTT